MKFLKQATYIRYVIAKLLNFVPTACRPLRFLFTEDSLEIKKGLELIFRAYFF